ncbi:unnamed protein product [Ambrosiozyma monospora]|uniref:Unnamed protein product n=1 Tax=Ambrosiozyma monospora TaxID=43982 RepID=A0A9W6Z8C8_AMBMO|nr:unnamed protein product [Ambrosiozyma monospora]
MSSVKQEQINQIVGDDTRKRPLEDSAEDVELSNDFINQVVRRLSVPADGIPTNVSKFYSNETNLSNEVQAYAKIAGRDWTFYVKSLRVLIGRNTDPHPPIPGQPAKEDEVDIDLGPSKVVSRRHASISYNMNTQRWELFILGRNGLKIDGKRVTASTRESPVVLTSGNVIDIGVLLWRYV